jgi:hypothetical protein
MSDINIFYRSRWDAGVEGPEKKSWIRLKATMNFNDDIIRAMSAPPMAEHVSLFSLTRKPEAVKRNSYVLCTYSASRIYGGHRSVLPCLARPGGGCTSK